MKKIFISLSIIIGSLSGFSQSVTILPTSILGGAGSSSNWTSSGTVTATTDLVGVGLSLNDGVFHPLHVRSSNNIPNGIMMEKRGNNIPYIQLLKYGGTVASPTAVTSGILGQIDFMGSWSGSGYTPGASILGRATGTFSQFDKPSQLEFLTTPGNLNTPPLTRMIIDQNGRLGLNSGTSTPVGTVDIRGVNSSSPTDPLLNLVQNGNTTSPGTTHVRFALVSTGNWAVNQEVVPAITQAGATVNFRYYDNSSPSVATHLFGYSNNTFSVTGAMNATGSSSIGTNFAVGGTSSLAGKVTIGSSSATTAGVEIRSSTSTDANPDIYLKGTNNVLRFGNNVDGTSIIQTTNSNNTPNSATLAWKHITNAATPVATDMMSIQGDGDLTVHGFTKLGNYTTSNVAATASTVAVTRSQPLIKQLYLTGTTNSGTTGFVSTDIPHGLDATKIISCEVLVNALNNFLTPPQNTFLTGYSYSVYTSGSNVNITFAGSTGNTALGGKTFKILITYIQ
jgi:hypothetical protein